MLLKIIIILLIVNTYITTEGAIRGGTNAKSSSSKVKEITLAIEHNLRDGHDQSNDSEKNSPSNRTRANLLINSKFIYPTESKRGTAFNQGILKFQQLLDLPINDTSNTQVTFINFDDKGGTEVVNITEHNKTLPARLGITEQIISPPKKLNILKHNKTIPFKSKCDNSSHEAESENSSKLLEKKFIEDFESSNETSVETDTIKKIAELSKFNENEENSKDKFNKTLEVEFVSSLSTKPSNETSDSKNITKGALEIIDDENGKKSNSSLNQTSYLNAKQKPKRGRVVEIKSQTVEEISLQSNHQNKASKRGKKQEDDDISQAIKRDILLGNLNPFFSNPSTSSIRNTNTLFFDDTITTPKSSALISPMNPFIINSVALDTSSPKSFSRSSFSRLRAKSSKSFKKAAVETVPSVSVSGGQKFSKSFSEFGTSRSSQQKATVKTVPALLIKQEDKKPKFSSKYRSSRRPPSSSAVSSVSFNIAPSVSKSRSSNIRTRTKSSHSFSRPRSSSISPVTSSTFSRPALPPSKISPSSSNVVEVLKSVEYSLPEEVGKSLTKTGASKFKRKVGFERRRTPEYNVQKSISMDPMTLNLHMTEKSDMIFNPYLVNTQMKRLSTESSRSFDFRPSVPDYGTSSLTEFSSALKKNSFFQPSSHFQRRTNPLQEESNIIEKPYFASDDEDVNQMQRINNLESEIIFKPYFVAQPSRSFQMPETTSNIYGENEVQVIDLSQL